MEKVLAWITKAKKISIFSHISWIAQIGNGEENNQIKTWQAEWKKRAKIKILKMN